MFAVKKYFCFELLTTGVLVGWLGLAKSISSFISSIVMLVKFDDFFTKDAFPKTDMDKFGPGDDSIVLSKQSIINQ